MGLIDWLFCDNTPNTNDLKELKKENDLNIKECEQHTSNKNNDTVYIMRYNNKLLKEIENHFKKYTYKSSYKGEYFYICYVKLPDISPFYDKDIVSFVVVDKTKFRNIVNYKKQGLETTDVFEKGLFNSSDIYSVVYDNTKMLKIDDLFNELGKEVYKDIDIKKDVESEMNYFFSKVGKCYED